MELVKGKEYKVKFAWNKRAVTAAYTGDRHTMDYDINEYPNGIAKFEGKSGVVFAPYEQIESVVEVDPTKVKPKTLKTCPRCLGNKHFEHLKHVNGGRCYKCGGTGKI